MTDSPAREGIDRRCFVAATAAVLAGALPCSALAAGPEAERAKPGDRLVVSDGEHKDKAATVDLVPLGGPYLKALPADIGSGVVRDKSRFNKLLLVRLAPDDIGEEFREHAADGVLAFSGVCTHQGCDVSAWIADKKLLACFCHHSEFDPANGGKVVSGPAKARLPIMPLTVTDGELRVAADFTSKPGPRK